MATIRSGMREQFDWSLFITIATIAFLGVTNLYSATSAAKASMVDIYITQIYWIALGALVAAVVAAIDYRHYERHGWVAYGVGVSLLILLFALGRSVRGSVRWLSIGAFSLQPSELMKIFLIIALAKYLHNDPKTTGRTLRDLVPPGLILSLPMVLILKQPDLGTALICCAIFASIMLLTNLKLQSLMTLVICFAAAIPLTWAFILEEYQKERAISFWASFTDPEKDMLGSGWHAYQSKVAIGSGGLWGKGFLQSTQNQYGFVPDQHSDFPFCIYAEEHGLVGVIVLLGAYFFLIIRGLKVASQAKDRFGAVLAVGVSAMFFFHTIINVGMVMGLLPVVGITLPLFSHGGSSVLTFMIGIGLLMNVSIRRFHF
jgi:rod shape determining protein RodA